ncbi:MAG: hypothetical protein K0Q91_794 [Fibrobacteria bacterium]|jgi:hypothetical protein|nr:hypothetical protein [Fibrobacteria bacterium]
MKTSTFHNRKIPFLLAIAGAALTGCFSESGNNPPDGVSASIRGTIQGDVEAGASGSSGSGWEGAVVTSHSILADGSLGAAEDSTTASANGSFTLVTEASGHQERILRARRGATEWMARFDGTLEEGETENCRPLNLESTLESAVYLELKKSAEGREVHSSEVNLAIDAEASASGSGAYRGTESQRAVLIASLAASVKAASRARNGFLAASDSLYNSYKAAIETERARAEAEFNASLHAAAGDTAEARKAQRAYVNAVVNAYLKANVKRTHYARAAEASYQAALRASLLISDSTRTRLARNYARVLVIASDTAMQHEFREAGSSQARLDLVAAAGLRFRTAVDTAGTRARLDSAVSRFRAEVRAAFNATTTGADTAGFNLFGAVSSTTGMNTLYNSLTTSLHAVLVGSSSDGEDVGEAYATAQASAQVSLQTAITAQNQNQDKARAAANLIAFISVHSSSN